MKITILAVGSQGDVQPYAVLGRGLARAGHSVNLASHETFRPMAKRCGVDFSLIAGNPMDIVNGPEGQSWLSSSDSYVSFLSRARKMAADLYPQMSRDALEAARGADALIFSLPLTVCGFSVAAALRVPGIPAALYPLHPTRAFPSIMSPNLSLGRPMNWLSGTVVMYLYWSIVRSLLGDFHRAQGLGNMPLQAPLRAMERQGLPFLYGYSPSVVPTPSRWPSTRTVGGYWFLEDSPEWKPEPRLAAFLQEGPAPLYVGFGSMTSGDPAGMTRVILEAVRRTGQRAVLSTGWGGLHTEDLPGVRAADRLRPARLAVCPGFHGHPPRRRGHHRGRPQGRYPQHHCAFFCRPVLLGQARPGPGCWPSTNSSEGAFRGVPGESHQDRS